MSFINFARAHGVEIDPSRFYASERIHRCGTIDKPRSGNGAWFWNGDRGWVMDWAGEAKVIWFQDPNAKPLTSQEYEELAEKRKKEKNRLYQQHWKAGETAQAILENAPYVNHPYLDIKGFPEEKGIVVDDKLLIPMRNIKTGRLQGYQEIYWDESQRKYIKKMMAGMMAKNGVWHMRQDGASERWLVEGYATGLSLHKALRSVGLKASVIVCFSAVNMVQVASQIDPDGCFIFADNDESKTGEKSAIETGLPWTMADEVGYDANDLHDKRGLMAVVKKVMDLRKEHYHANTI
jgi:putative DNA primase/helicase